ncbi:hypothetical protein M3Y95_00002900 [Aphelenchoides besseyi]|nr:hypothetical protein M3Y95_00002900 [Aphelenchoides besseyi]
MPQCQLFPIPFKSIRSSDSLKTPSDEEVKREILDRQRLSLENAEEKLLELTTSPASSRGFSFSDSSVDLNSTFPRTQSVSIESTSTLKDSRLTSDGSSGARLSSVHSIDRRTSSLSSSTTLTRTSKFSKASTSTLTVPTITMREQSTRTTGKSEKIVITNGEYGNVRYPFGTPSKKVRSLYETLRTRVFFKTRLRLLRPLQQQSQIWGIVRINELFFKLFQRQIDYRTFSNGLQYPVLIDKITTCSQLLHNVIELLEVPRGQLNYALYLRYSTEPSSDHRLDGQFVDDWTIKTLRNGFVLELSPSPMHFAERAVSLFGNEKTQIKALRNILLLLDDEQLSRWFVRSLNLFQLLDIVFDWIPEIDESCLPDEFDCCELLDLTTDEQWSTLDELTNEHLEILDRTIEFISDSNTDEETFSFSLKFVAMAIERCVIFAGVYLNRIDLKFIEQLLHSYYKWNIADILTIIIAICDAAEDEKEEIDTRQMLSTELFADFFYTAIYVQLSKNDSKLKVLLSRLLAIRTVDLLDCLSFTPTETQIDELKTTAETIFNQPLPKLDDLLSQLPSGSFGFDQLSQALENPKTCPLIELVQNDELTTTHFLNVYFSLLDHLLGLMLPLMFTQVLDSSSSQNDLWSTKYVCYEEEERCSELKPDQYSVGYNLLPKSAKRTFRLSKTSNEIDELYNPLLICENHAISRMHQVLCSLFRDMWMLPSLQAEEPNRRVQMIVIYLSQILESSCIVKPLNLRHWLEQLANSNQIHDLYQRPLSIEQVQGHKEDHKIQWKEIMRQKVVYRMEDLLWDQLILRMQNGYIFNKFVFTEKNKKLITRMGTRKLELDDNETFFTLHDEDEDENASPKEIHSGEIHKIIEGLEYEEKCRNTFFSPTKSTKTKFLHKLKTLGRHQKIEFESIPFIPRGIIVQTNDLEEYEILERSSEDCLDEFLEGLRFLKNKTFPKPELDMLVELELNVRNTTLQHIDEPQDRIINESPLPSLPDPTIYNAHWFYNLNVSDDLKFCSFDNEPQM